ncbi:MAG: hypothetical protein J6331_00715 [Lentisphaeria bacterium]|nr:hypothetical protein [Lentisphaeria bacterium]
MKDAEIAARMEEFSKLFSDIPDDVLMRFANRTSLQCTVFDRCAILRALAVKSNTGREQLKAFLCGSVPDVLRRTPAWGGYSSLKSRYEKHISCNGCCLFDPPFPEINPANDREFVKNAQEVAKRDRELLKKLQQNDEVLLRRDILEEAEFNTACGDSESARAEAAFRDGVVKAKLAELERYVKEQMAELRRENLLYLGSLRQELLEKTALRKEEKSPLNPGVRE